MSIQSKRARAMVAIALILVAGFFLFYPSSSTPNAGQLNPSSKQVSSADSMSRTNPDAQRRHRFARKSKQKPNQQKNEGHQSILLSAPDAPLQALEQALALEQPDRDLILSKLIPELTRHSIDSALRACEAIEAPLKRRDGFAFVLAQWTTKDPEAAFAWLASTKQASLVKEAAEERMLLAFANRNPREAAIMLGDGKISATSLPKVVHGTLKRWCQHDPSAAAAWVENFEEGHLRDQSVAALVKAWHSQDATATEQWVSNLEQPALRVRALAVLASLPKTD